MIRAIEKLRQNKFEASGEQLETADIIITQKELKQKKGVVLPEEVINFLHHFNGFSYDGGQIYGIYNPDVLTNNIITENQKNNIKNCIVLGHNEFDYLVYNNILNNYQILDKEDFEILEEYLDFDDGFSYIIKI